MSVCILLRRTSICLPLMSTTCGAPLWLVTVSTKRGHETLPAILEVCLHTDGVAFAVASEVADEPVGSVHPDVVAVVQQGDGRPARSPWFQIENCGSVPGRWAARTVSCRAAVPALLIFTVAGAAGPEPAAG